jgi:hypothetical protein
MIRLAWVEAGRYIVDVDSKAVLAGIGITAALEIAWPQLLAPGWFVFTLLILNSLELGTCFRGKHPLERRDFNWERHIVGKLMILSIAIVALVMDSMVLVIARTIPTLYEFPVIGQGFLPITVATLFWLNSAEAYRVIKNVANSEGDMYIPPMVLWILRQIKMTDEARYHVLAGQHLPKDVPTPPKRWYDNLTEEEVQDFVEYMKTRSNDPPPPGI